ncbi:MAG: polyprenyl synthetase family protein [Anaerolineales bacterium]|nr:polyprenyl synthetase family protein [Anaerolineales bacterium]
MSFESLSQIMLPALEEELKQSISRSNDDGYGELHNMLAYHLGWTGEGSGPKAMGKRIRPLMLLLITSAAGGEWNCALPAAAAVELVHNFSLIHDDIEDDSPLRRGRPTLWKKWGMAQAINAGDAMFSLAHLAILRLEETTSKTITLKASQILHGSCLQLTQGQYLDIAYEERGDLSIDAYWPMVGGKTAALLSACTEIGALIARSSDEARSAYQEFGNSLGLAFQTKDDLLGIWGDAALTGKSADSDLITGKKSLPVLYGLSQNGAFAKRWAEGPILPNEVSDLANQLADEGTRDYTQKISDKLTQKALHSLSEANPQGEAGMALVELANQLLNRQQ